MIVVCITKGKKNCTYAVLQLIKSTGMGMGQQFWYCYMYYGVEQLSTWMADDRRLHCWRWEVTDQIKIKRNLNKVWTLIII